MKDSVEFELKDFSKVYNQNQEVLGIQSAKYKYGEYNWCIKADVEKLNYSEDGNLWLIIYLYCISDNPSNFPLFTRMNFIVLNKDKDTRKDFSKCNYNFYFDLFVKK